MDSVWSLFLLLDDFVGPFEPLEVVLRRGGVEEVYFVSLKQFKFVPRK